MRIALLMSGELRTFWYAVESQLENLINPYEVDVFIFAGSVKRGRQPHPLNLSKPKTYNKGGGSYSSRHNPLGLEFNEKLFAKNKLGERLKRIKFVEDDINYENEYHELNKLKNEEFNKRFNRETRRDNNGVEYNRTYVGPVTYVVDQYFRFRKAFQLMEKYEKKHNFQYDIVMRFRPDFIVSNFFDFEKYLVEVDLANNLDNFLYIKKEPKVNERFHCHENYFFGSRNIMKKFAYDFVDQYGTKLFPHDLWRKFNKNKMPLTQLNSIYNSNYVAECAFGLFAKDLDCPKYYLQPFKCDHTIKTLNIDKNFNIISQQFEIDKVMSFYFVC